MMELALLSSSSILPKNGVAAPYRIMSGTVSVFKEFKGQDMLLYELGPGDVFSEMVFIDGGNAPRSASTVAKDALELEAWQGFFLQNTAGQQSSPSFWLAAEQAPAQCSDHST